MRDLHACQANAAASWRWSIRPRASRNLHTPNDVIVDASMPAMIRVGGKMWGADGQLKETKAVMPEIAPSRASTRRSSTSARRNGAFDPKTMGTVPNVGLMAQQAEEYGSHDKTFEIPEDGVARIVDIATGDVLLEQNVEAGDIWRMCQVKDARDPRLGQARRHARPQLRHAGGVLARPVPSARGRADQEGRDLPKDHDTDRPRHPDHVAGARDALHARARGARPGHHLGHRQHPARLPDRPVPDHGARHQRQDAVDRAADGRRRHVRDRRRRLGAQARAAAGRGKPPALGFARRVPGAGGVASKTSASRPATRRPRSWPRRSTRPPASCSTTTSRPRPRPASSTTAAASSTWRCTGRRRWPRRPRTRSWRRSSRRWPKALAENEQKIVDELTAVQGKPVDIGGYYLADAAKAEAVMRPSATFNAAMDALAADGLIAISWPTTHQDSLRRREDQGQQGFLALRARQPDHSLHRGRRHRRRHHAGDAEGGRRRGEESLRRQEEDRLDGDVRRREVAQDLRRERLAARRDARRRRRNTWSRSRGRSPRRWAAASARSTSRCARSSTSTSACGRCAGSRACLRR